MHNKDGDTQQSNKYLDILYETFSNAFEGGCGWHICEFLYHFFNNYKLNSSHVLTNKHIIIHIFDINQSGVEVHVGRCPFSPKGLDWWNQVVRKIHLWVYSWMRPNYVIDNKEYQTSKYLMTKFIHSQTVLDDAEWNYHLVHRIHMLFHQHIYVHEHLYLYFKRMRVRYFEVSHSSPHKVTIYYSFPF